MNLGEPHPIYGTGFRWDGARWRAMLRPRKRDKEQCLKLYCKNVRRIYYKKGNDTQYQNSLCRHCESVLRRINHPLRWSYDDKRQGAKRRGIPFEITFEQWCKFATRHNLLRPSENGARERHLHVDRIDPTRHYTIDNIQPLTRAENTAKRNKEYAKGQYWRGPQEEPLPPSEDPNNPF